MAVSHYTAGIAAERSWLRESYFEQLGFAQLATEDLRVLNEIALQYQAEVYALRQAQRRVQFERYVRSVNPVAPAEQIVDAVLKAEVETGIEAPWLLAKLKQESYFNPHAVSSTGCRGLAQMCRAASRDVGLDPAKVFEVHANVLAGARYLKLQLNAVGGDMNMALVKYNGNDDPLFVQRVRSHRANLLRATGGV